MSNYKGKNGSAVGTKGYSRPRSYGWVQRKNTQARNNGAAADMHGNNGSAVGTNGHSRPRNYGWGQRKNTQARNSGTTAADVQIDQDFLFEPIDTTPLIEIKYPQFVFPEELEPYQNGSAKPLGQRPEFIDAIIEFYAKKGYNRFALKNIAEKAGIDGLEKALEYDPDDVNAIFLEYKEQAASIILTAEEFYGMKPLTLAKQISGADVFCVGQSRKSNVETIVEDAEDPAENTGEIEDWVNQWYEEGMNFGKHSDWRAA